MAQARRPHTFTYLVRATRAGVFNALPAHLYLMYSPEVWGHSASRSIRVGEVNAVQTVAPMGQIVKTEKVLE